MSTKMFLELRELLRIDLKKRKITKDTYDLAMDRVHRNFPEVEVYARGITIIR